LAQPIPEGNKIKAEVVKPLSNDDIKYFHQENIWPTQFFHDISHIIKEKKDSTFMMPPDYSDTESDDDSSFEIYNPNRKQLYAQETDSSEEECESDSDSEQ